MSARSERPKNRRVKLVGGGYKWTRSNNEKAKGGSIKSQRRTLRQTVKTKRRSGKLSVEEHKAIKVRLAELLAQKDKR